MLLKPTWLLIDHVLSAEGPLSNHLQARPWPTHRLPQALAAALRSGCRRVVVVGNGGIALELVGCLSQLAAASGSSSTQGGSTVPDTGLQGSGAADDSAGGGGGLEVVWAMRHGHVGDAFFDVDAADFLLRHWSAANVGGGGVEGQPQGGHSEEAGAAHAASGAAQGAAQTANTQGSHQAGAGPARSVVKPTESSVVGTAGAGGHAAGPTWTQQLQRAVAAGGAGDAGGAAAGAAGRHHALRSAVLEFEAQVRNVRGGSGGWPVEVELSNGKVGRGVLPDSRWAPMSPSMPPFRPPFMPGALIPWTPVSQARPLAWQCGDDACALQPPRPRMRPAIPCNPSVLQMQVYGADVVVSAIGVEPTVHAWLAPGQVARAPDGGVVVDSDMRVVLAGPAEAQQGSLYAAGDCATLRECDCAPHFFQMRLWGQVGRPCGPGRLEMGSMCAHKAVLHPVCFWLACWFRAPHTHA